MTATTEQQPRSAQHDGRRRALPLWIMAGAVLAIVLAGAVAGALRSPPALDPASPQGVTQAYLQAVLDRDHATAAGHLSTAGEDPCTVADFRNGWVPENLTATLDDVRVSGGDATVRVRLRSIAGPGPFGGDGYESLETFTLVSEAGAWRITGAPWPLFDCDGSPK